MRKPIAILVATVIAVTPVAASPAVTTANVNMRSGPGTTYEVLGTIDSGTDIDLGECDASGAWCSVTVDGRQGYMSGQYIEMKDDPGGWPRSFTTQSGGQIILYQPQVTDWQDFRTIDALIAAEYVSGPNASAVYGVIGVTGKTEADEANDEVVISDITVTELNFSALDREGMDALNVDVGQVLPTGPITVAEQRLVASLADSKRVADVDGLKSDAPPIFHSETPAILVQTNGDASLAPVQNTTGLSFVVNSNWDILTETGQSTYYLRDEQSWLSATSLDGEWSAVDTLPAAFSGLPADDESWTDARAAIPPKPFQNGAPKVFYSTQPAELILFDGPPKKEAVPGTALEWVSNTETDLFFDTATSTWYVLLSGRWFSATSLDGPWTFATPNLPDDFHKLPADTPYYSVRYAVPGTSESDEARLKASIPRTARVEIGSVTPDEVAYDGDPKFEAIDGTQMTYAVNTNDDVIKVGEQYFLLQNGVWFVGASPTGPWAVAQTVPDTIYTIPPSSPVYNTTYVRVYETEPGAVWFGYTMGYLTGYLAWGTFVYGTGYRYDPYWYRGVRPYPGYFPRPVTYGMGAYYNPVRGTYGRYGYAYGPYRGIAAGARYNPRTGTYVRGGQIYGPAGSRGFMTAYNPRTDTRAVAHGGQNIYGSWGTAGIQRGSAWARVSGGRNDAGGGALRWNTSGGGSGFVGDTRNGNIYAGRDGNVYRNTGDGWQKFDRGDGWTGANRPAGATAAAGPARPADRTAANRPAGDRPAAQRPAERAPAANRPAANRPAAQRPRASAQGPEAVRSQLQADMRGRQAGNLNQMRQRDFARSPARGNFERAGGGRSFGGGGRFGGGRRR